MNDVLSSCITILEDDILYETDQVLENQAKFFKFANKYGNDESMNGKVKAKIAELEEKTYSRNKGGFFRDEIRSSLVTQYESILAHFKGNDASFMCYVLANINYKKELFLLLKSICEQVIFFHINLLNQLEIVQGGNPSQTLFSELRKIDCKFLNPKLQDEFLKFTIRLFENTPSCSLTLSSQTLIEYLRLMLKNDFPDIQKKDLEMAVNLLNRAGCLEFKYGYLVEIKKKFLKYDTLRRQHDTFIIALAREFNMEMGPKKWSQTLYGNDLRTPEMQSIIAQLRKHETFTKLINKFFSRILEFNITKSDLQPMLDVRCDFEKIDAIYLKKQHLKSFDPISSVNNDPSVVATSNDVYILWMDLAESFECTRKILKAHVEFSSKMSKMIVQQQAQPYPSDTPLNGYHSNSTSRVLF